MIREVVLTTLDAAGAPHVAPLGVHMETTRVIVAPYRPSRTLENILQSGHAVVNCCDDVRLFAGPLTGRRGWPVTPADVIPGVRLAAALAHWELRLESVEDDALRPRLYCRVVRETSHRPFCGFNRAQAAVVEAAILVSRLHLLPRDKILAELDHLRIAVEKTAGPTEQEAWGWLMQAVALPTPADCAASRSP